MTNRYLTHLSTALLLHIMVLAGSFSLLNPTTMPQVFNVSPSVLRLQVATEVVIGQTFPQIRKKVVSKSAPVQSEARSEEQVNSAASDSNSRTQIGSANGTVDAGARDIFKAELRAEIEKNKSYPPMSRRLGQTGTVVVAFTLLEDGHIIDVRLDTPSRYERLNDSALEAVKKVHKFKPIPSDWNEAKMDITVPVKFLAI